jgi:peptidoglycan/xylan/chitin deacetylase (PgdA/CDA1 family)
VSIFTLHRFAVPGLQVRGHDPSVLGSILDRLRREGYHLMGLADLATQFAERRPVPRRTVVFTVDDGYRDFALVAADVFLKYDCPVTVFLPTGFIDGTIWLWWDQVAHIMLTTTKPSIAIELGNESLTLVMTDRADRLRTAHALSVQLTSLEEGTRVAFIGRLALAAEVRLPLAAPERFAPMDWAEARRLEGRGVTFGPHTVTHPVLTRTTHAQAATEISESWRVLRERLSGPVNIFCYPNGSFGDRELGLVAASGLGGGVTSAAGYASAHAFHRTATARFAIPRFPYPDDSDALCLTASGFSRVALSVRRAVGPRAAHAP